MDSRLTTAFIHQNLQIDLTDIDPETDIFHPYPVVGKIFGLVELSYKKRREDVNKIVGNFNRDDYQTLLDRDACQSFNQFHEAIHG
jgi:transcriptional regulator of NAD metabolism